MEALHVGACRSETFSLLVHLYFLSLKKMGDGNSQSSYWPESYTSLTSELYCVCIRHCPQQFMNKNNSSQAFCPFEVISTTLLPLIMLLLDLLMSNIYSSWVRIKLSHFLFLETYHKLSSGSVMSHSTESSPMACKQQPTVKSRLKDYLNFNAAASIHSA